MLDLSRISVKRRISKTCGSSGASYKYIPVVSSHVSEPCWTQTMRFVHKANEPLPCLFLFLCSHSLYSFVSDVPPGSVSSTRHSLRAAFHSRAAPGVRLMRLRLLWENRVPASAALRGSASPHSHSWPQGLNIGAERKHILWKWKVKMSRKKSGV